MTRKLYFPGGNNIFEFSLVEDPQEHDTLFNSLLSWKQVCWLANKIIVKMIIEGGRKIVDVSFIRGSMRNMVPVVYLLSISIKNKFSTDIFRYRINNK